MMSRRLVLITFLLIGIAQCLMSQATRAPKNDHLDQIVDRLEILYGDSVSFHSSLSDINRKQIAETAFKIANSEYKLTEKEQDDLDYIFADNNEWVKYFESRSKTDLVETNQSSDIQYIDSTNRFYRLNKDRITTGSSTQYVENSKPFLKYFYKTPANLFEYDHKDFFLRLNPVLNIKYGEATNDDNLVFQNTRGFTLRGTIDNKVYFFTSLYENQQRFLYHIEDRISKDLAVPGNGFYKRFQSGVIDNLNGWDYLNAEAYVGFNISKSIGIEFGHSNHFIGNGQRSLLLGDYSNNYFFLKFNTNFWKVHYQNIFAELSVYGNFDVPADLLIPKKYLTAHYLDFKVNKNFSIGVFEAVVFNRENNFEFQYLNPLIIYRTVEQFIGSPDNVLIGINSKLNFLNQFQLYGQIVFDEFKIDQLTSGDGWWANKYGIQLGLKYINMLGVDHLDGQVELNRARPFLYSHRGDTREVENKAIGSYSHYNLPLAHPLGSNFNEVLFVLRYTPVKDLTIETKALYAQHGTNPDGENWGGDILLSSDSRIQNFGNEIGQGVSTTISQLSMNISYQLFHNFNIDLNTIYRNTNSENDLLDRNTTYIGMGVRMNVSNQILDY